MYYLNRVAPPQNDSGQRHTLLRDTPAIEISRSKGGLFCLEPISKIPEGAEIEYDGQGINDETVRIRWRGKVYLMFVYDLDGQSERDKPSNVCRN